MSSPERSPSPEAESEAPPPAPQNTPEKPGSPEPAMMALAIVDRLSQEDMAVDVKVVGGAVSGGEGDRGLGNGCCAARKAESGLVAVPGILRRRAVTRAAFGLRVSAALLSLVSFSVMAADSTEGWAGDSFGRYSEYRYLVCVNAIAFAYSAFQAYTKVHYLILKKLIIRRPMSYYFDLSMDQVLAYLLMSASSAAASRNDLWISRFGADEFMDMANGSIAISFLAFVALASSSLISARNLFAWNSNATS
ncbi:CASP-like protein 4A3 [Musa acuminata AAA Group]|uniref:CASP-like protein 4A3 n=1 Tax=Musa acuminata AAA Group TaxID=214697 RepID=UPI0031E3EE29